ncbi:hypothetical protein TNCV_3842211 [Trichonephila clavipes]|nr:hypothetical protein TNCV_3842211 [Trichonephila clavipes]
MRRSLKDGVRESAENRWNELFLDNASGRGCGDSHTRQPIISRSFHLNRDKNFSPAKRYEDQNFTKYNVLFNLFGIKCLLVKSCVRPQATQRDEAGLFPVIAKSGADRRGKFQSFRELLGKNFANGWSEILTLFSQAIPDSQRRHCNIVLSFSHDLGTTARLRTYNMSRDRLPTWAVYEQGIKEGLGGEGSDNKVLLFTAVMRPILAYGCLVWGYAAKTNINILDTVQNSTIRMIVKATRYMRNDDIRKAIKINSLNLTSKKYQKTSSTLYNLPII